MTEGISAGMSTTRRFLVDRSRTIGFMGEALRVYSTPSMVLDVEDVCKDFLQQHLDAASSSVGSHVEVDHLGATLLDMWVDIAVTVTSVEGRKVAFEARITDALELVGTARHTRVVVNLERQAQRLDSKRAKVSELGERESGRR